MSSFAENLVGMSVQKHKARNERAAPKVFVHVASLGKNNWPRRVAVFFFGRHLSSQRRGVAWRSGWRRDAFIPSEHISLEGVSHRYL